MLLLNSCGKQGPAPSTENNPSLTKLSEFVVSSSSQLKLVVIKPDKKDLAKRYPIKNVYAVSTNQNINPATEPISLGAFTLKKFTPGESGFFNPMRKKLYAKSVAAGAPESSVPAICGVRIIIRPTSG